MCLLRRILIYLLVMLAIFGSYTLKIGISKPLPTTTTMTPTTTTEASSEDLLTEVSLYDTTESLIVKSKTTTTSDREWYEFPPKKSSKTSNKTTTEKPLATTVKPSTSTGSTNETIFTQDSGTVTTSIQKWPNQQKYCFCDLTKNDCDINCCCDQECSMEALKVFRCQLGTANDLEEQEGRFENFKFQHGLPSCELNDGWLCVFRTNQPVAKEESANYLKDNSRYYNWPNLLLESQDVTNREFYKLGDLMRIINIETKQILNFDFPSSFELTSCQIREPIYYLKPSKKSCPISSYENLRKAQLEVLQLEKYKVFNTPLIPDGSYNNKRLEQIVGNITIFKCQKYDNNCNHYQEEKDNGTHNALFKVKVNILHNFTHIQEIIVDLWFENLKEVTFFNNFEQDIWLSYEAEFFNKTLKDLRALKSQAYYESPNVSGPLGYLPGKPLIVARYQPFNKSQPLSTRNQVLNYFSVNNTDSYAFSLLAKDNGVCKLSKTSEEFISYGINMAYYCKIKFENNSVIEEEPLNSNFTEICLNLQQRVHDHLLGPDISIEDLSLNFISKLGKPQNTSNKWLQLQVYNTDFDTVVGHYLLETNTFVCRNVLLSLSYEFHMATYTVDNIPLQNVIKHAVLHLAERHDLEFSLNENLEIPITMTVRFYDVREEGASVSAGYNFRKLDLFWLLFLLIVTLFTLNNQFMEL